jgi:curved DNA-binding protein CbpA
MSTFNDALQLLGLSDAEPSKEAISKAYKRAALRWHPGELNLLGYTISIC